MLSLICGLAAALAWGVHDVCVRFAAHRAGVVLALAAVLVSGLVLLLPAAVLAGAWAPPGPAAMGWSVAAGLAYAVAGYALYRAFDLGPVRLVAPVVGSFPILSVLWAAAGGTLPTVDQMIAVAAIAAGVGLTAALGGDHGPTAGTRGRALAWALAACAGFALTFALGQAAHVAGGLATTLVARAISTVVILGVVIVTAPRPPAGRLPWGLLVIMGAADAAALTLVFLAGSLAHPEYAAVSASTFGVVTILLAWLFLKEPLSLPQGLAVLMVFGGIGYLAA